MTPGKEARAITKALRKVGRPEEMARGVADLEQRQVSARDRLENLLARPQSRRLSLSFRPPWGPEAAPTSLPTTDLQSLKELL